MEWGCWTGEEHYWLPTGGGYYLWQDSTTTSVPHPPEGAPYYREYKCAICEQTTHFCGMPPNT